MYNKNTLNILGRRAAKLVRSSRSLRLNGCRPLLRKVRDAPSWIWPNIHPNFAAPAYLRSGLLSFVVEIK